jgi:hypothetical protein
MNAQEYAAAKRWKNGGESAIEYFYSLRECLKWIDAQPAPKTDEYTWVPMRYDSED